MKPRTTIFKMTALVVATALTSCSARVPDQTPPSSSDAQSSAYLEGRYLGDATGTFSAFKVDGSRYHAWRQDCPSAQDERGCEESGTLSLDLETKTLSLRSDDGTTRVGAIDSLKTAPIPIFSGKTGGVQPRIDLTPDQIILGVICLIALKAMMGGGRGGGGGSGSGGGDTSSGGRGSESWLGGNYRGDCGPD
jgi:hypothetical protein